MNKQVNEWFNNAIIDGKNEEFGSMISDVIYNVEYTCLKMGENDYALYAEDEFAPIMCRTYEEATRE